MQPPIRDREGQSGRRINKTVYDFFSRAWGAIASGGRIPLHEAQLSESVLKTTWLPYFERFLLVIWLFFFTLLFQEHMLHISATGLERVIIALLGIWISLIVMGIALRRSGYHEPVGYQARMRRRISTFLATTLWMVLLSLGFDVVMSN
jgi:hypothetical protein